VGVTRSGRRGPPSARAEIPLTALPPPPTDLSVRFTETNLIVEWKPSSEIVTAYNVYRSGEPMQPLNRDPLTSLSFEHAFSKFDEPQCFQVRSVAKAGRAFIEGDVSPERCVTPIDTFAPAAPQGLALVPIAGQISLIWDANTEKDLAGYLVLRGEAPNGPLEPVTPAPIRETSFRDTTVNPGTRYIYAIVAVDSASPPNRSAESPRVEETAR
jgi:fibronectin type 3 domain-containing protein